MFLNDFDAWKDTKDTKCFDTKDKDTKEFNAVDSTIEFESQQKESKKDERTTAQKIYDTAMKVLCGLGLSVLVGGVAIGGTGFVGSKIEQVNLNNAKVDTSTYLSDIKAQGESIEEKIAYVEKNGSEPQKVKLDLLQKEEDLHNSGINMLETLAKIGYGASIAGLGMFAVYQNDKASKEREKQRKSCYDLEH